MRESRPEGAWGHLSGQRTPSFLSSPSKGAPAVRGLTGGSLPRPRRPDGALLRSAPSTPAPASRPLEVPLFPGVGSGSVLSVVALVPLPRPRVAMTGEATSLARLLLDSSCIGLFPARRSSHLKQGEARPFFESGRGRRTSGWRPSPPPASLPRSLSTWAQVRRLLLALLLRVQPSVL